MGEQKDRGKSLSISEFLSSFVPSTTDQCLVISEGLTRFGSADEEHGSASLYLAPMRVCRRLQTYSGNRNCRRHRAWPTYRVLLTLFYFFIAQSERICTFEMSKTPASER